MNISSDITSRLVKPNLVASGNFSDSADVADKAESHIVRAAEQSGQDGQDKRVGFTQGRLLSRPIRVPVSAGSKAYKIPGRYYLWAVLDGYQGDHDSCWPSVLTLAQNCRRKERQIRRWLDKLRCDGKIWIDRRGKLHRYRVNRSRTITTFVFVDPRWVWKLGLSINQAVVFGYVRFKCNGKLETWFSIHSCAAYLRLSYNTIRRCLAVLAAWGFIEIRPGRLRGGRTNRYKPAPFGRLASWENYPKRARPKCPVKRNTYAAHSYPYANFGRNGSLPPEFGLSFSPERDHKAYELLVKLRTDRQVARSAAVQWRGYVKSVEQAIINGAYRFEADTETLRRHNLAPLRGTYVGYVIGTLNRAYREGHRVRPSKLVAAAQARGDDGARAAAGGGVTESVIEQRKREQIRRLFMPPAKPPTPPKVAIPAENLQFHDKTADDAFLTRTLRIARRNWAAHHKYANLPQKVGFSVDSCQ